MALFYSLHHPIYAVSPLSPTIFDRDALLWLQALLFRDVLKLETKFSGDFAVARFMVHVILIFSEEQTCP